MREVVKKDVIKLLDAEIIYPVPHNEWVSPVHCVSKKGGLTMVNNEKNELIPQRTVTEWRMCIDYRKLNKATKKDHFPLPFIDEMLERLANHTCGSSSRGWSSPCSHSRLRAEAVAEASSTEPALAAVPARGGAPSRGGAVRGGVVAMV
jgi:hypothetical protein